MLYLRYMWCSRCYMVYILPFNWIRLYHPDFFSRYHSSSRCRKIPGGLAILYPEKLEWPQKFRRHFFFYLILFLVSFLIGPVLFFRDLYKQLQNKGPDF